MTGSNPVLGAKFYQNVLRNDLSKNSIDVKNWRKNTKNKLVLAMGGCCQICGYDRCNDALEFHHLDPDKKDFHFGTVRSNPKNIMILVAEAKKCVLLCANCHKEYHAGIVDIPKNHAVLDESIALSKRKKCKICKTYFLDIKRGEFCSPQCQGKFGKIIQEKKKTIPPLKNKIVKIKKPRKKILTKSIQQSKEKYNKLIESGINLSEYGWVMKSSRYLGISHTQVKRLINKYHSGPVYRNGTIIELMPPSSNG